MGHAAVGGGQLTFESHDVSGLLSVAHLFPGSQGRTGIYVLHFEDGHGYVGQTLDVVGRWAAHRRRWPDMVRLEFARVTKAHLDTTERSQIHARQGTGLSLRNVTHALGNPIAESDLDWVVEPSQQHAWLTHDAWQLADVEVRVDDRRQRLSKRSQYQKLARRQDFQAVEFTLRTYVQLCVPRPRATELTFWALSALPATNRSTAPRLAALSINKMETLVLGHLKDNPEVIWSFINVSKTALTDAAGSLKSFLASTPTASSDGKGRYEASGYDAIPIYFDHPAAIVMTLIENPALLHAARALNMRLMRKGPTFQWRGHCFDLADHAVVEFEDSFLALRTQASPQGVEGTIQRRCGNCSPN
jgi:hypothetical protein